MFAKNCWYICAEPMELTDGAIVSRQILGTQVAIYRTGAGTPVAVEDRCPHRLVPLSLGHVDGEILQCAYHGARFDTTGTCVEVPGTDRIARGICVRTYPLVEKFGYLWIWMGDPEKSADLSSIPPGFDVSGDTSLIGGYGKFEDLAADYRLVNDNLFDITHAEFVHPESFGGEEVRFYRKSRKGTGLIDRGMTYNIEDNSVHFRTYATALGQEGAPLWRSMLAQKRGREEWPEPIDFLMEVDWWAPSYTSFHITVRPQGEHDSTDTAEIYNLHALTPATENSCHYFYRSIRNYGDESLNAPFIEAADAIFAQDKPILEAQQRLVGDGDLFDHKTVSFNGDHLQLAGRKILDAFIAAADG